MLSRRFRACSHAFQTCRSGSAVVLRIALAVVVVSTMAQAAAFAQAQPGGIALPRASGLVTDQSTVTLILETVGSSEALVEWVALADGVVVHRGAQKSCRSRPDGCTFDIDLAKGANRIVLVYQITRAAASISMDVVMPDKLRRIHEAHIKGVGQLNVATAVIHRR